MAILHSLEASKVVLTDTQWGVKCRPYGVELINLLIVKKGASCLPVGVGFSSNSSVKLSRNAAHFGAGPKDYKINSE